MRLMLLVLLSYTTTVVYSQTEEVEKLTALHKQKFEWLINGNTDSLTILLDDKVKYIHSNGWIQNKREVLEDRTSGKLVYKNIQVEESEVAIEGNTAIVTGKGTFAGEMNGTSFSIKLLYSETYAKVKNRWKLVNRHACKLL